MSIKLNSHNNQNNSFTSLAPIALNSQDFSELEAYLMIIIEKIDTPFREAVLNDCKKKGIKVETDEIVPVETYDGIEAIAVEISFYCDTTLNECIDTAKYYINKLIDMINNHKDLKLNKTFTSHYLDLTIYFNNWHAYYWVEEQKLMVTEPGNPSIKHQENYSVP